MSTRYPPNEFGVSRTDDGLVRVDRWGVTLDAIHADKLGAELLVAVHGDPEADPPTRPLHGAPSELAVELVGVDPIRAEALRSAAARLVYGSPTPQIAIPTTLDVARAFEAYLRGDQ